MRRSLLGIALVVAIVVVWQLQRGKAAPLHHEPVIGNVVTAPSSGAPTPRATTHTDARPERTTVTEDANAPTPATENVVSKEARKAFAKAASSFIPPHQQANPDVWGIIIGTRLRWFNEELADQEPSAEWTRAMQERLEKALPPDSHLLSADCRETTCKVELIYEQDLGALDFNNQLADSPVKQALEGDFASFIERGDDGQLKNIIYVERDGPGLMQKFADLLDWDEEE